MMVCIPSSTPEQYGIGDVARKPGDNKYLPRLVAVETLQGHPALQVLRLIFFSCFHHAPHQFNCRGTSCCVFNARQCHLLDTSPPFSRGEAEYRECQRDARGMLSVTSPCSECKSLLLMDLGHGRYDELPTPVRFKL